MIRPSVSAEAKVVKAVTYATQDLEHMTRLVTLELTIFLLDVDNSKYR